MQVCSKETRFPTFIVHPAVDGGYQWKLRWRYEETSRVFSTADEALADAQKRYEALREETATVRHGRRGEHKEYHI